MLNVRARCWVAGLFVPQLGKGGAGSGNLREARGRLYTLRYIARYTTKKEQEKGSFPAEPSRQKKVSKQWAPCRPQRPCCSLRCPQPVRQAGVASGRILLILPLRTPQMAGGDMVAMTETSGQDLNGCHARMDEETEEERHELQQ